MTTNIGMPITKKSSDGEAICSAIKKIRDEHSVIKRMIDMVPQNTDPQHMANLLHLWKVHERDEKRLLNIPGLPPAPEYIEASGENLRHLAELSNDGILGDAIDIPSVREEIIKRLNEHMSKEEAWLSELFASVIGQRLPCSPS